MATIKRALISVSDKQGLVDFAKGLSRFKIAILSTGGTAQALRDSGLEVEDVSHYTGFPEMLDGRVKTLHPKIHGGLLGRRSLPAHVSKMKEHGIEPIDMVVVNLYPFEATIAKEGCTFEDAIENIDIGGPAMIRSAAKNHADVTVVIDPGDYKAILEEMERSGGSVSAETNFGLAKKVFQNTARYDGAIANYLGSLRDGEKDLFPEVITLQYNKADYKLRYGENPHQKGAFYRELSINEPCIAGATLLQGKEISYNNIMDADAALDTVKEFEETAVVIIKHSNPCGVARSTAIAGGCLPQGSVLRSHFRLRRHRRPQPALRRRDGQGHHLHLYRGGHRPGLLGGSPKHLQRQEGYPPARSSLHQRLCLHRI